ncbi:hypothetical protein ACIBL3_02155 [Kribbella sp. NPDC050124]|uniref:hypothetical protein n=1 Tax=Kribbella sp. NPDC050124 TaxID=3364114 RepID=UPI003792D50B
MKKLGVVAAGLFVAYGIVRLVDGRDGEHGPGRAWTVGHVLFLVGILLYGVVLVRARGLLRARHAAGTAAVVVGFAGVAAFARVFVVDLIVGFRAEDHAAMSRIGDEYERWPGDLGIYEPLYNVGPLLFLAGLLTLAVLLTVERQLPVWSPVLLLVGFVLISVNLDLMPLGGALLGLAFVSNTTGSRDRRRTSAAL